jgi:hypothetical protein
VPLLPRHDLAPPAKTAAILASRPDSFKRGTSSLRPYGWDAVSGRPRAAGTAAPVEIGLLFVATAPTQALATEAAKTCNPYFFHLPVREGKELPSYALPFSPAEIERGPVYEFRLNHVVETTSPFELVRTRWVTLDAAGAQPRKREEMTHDQA